MASEQHKKAMRRLAFVDIEITGGNAQQDQITEIATIGFCCATGICCKHGHRHKSVL